MTYEELVKELDGNEGLLSHISMEYWCKHYNVHVNRELSFNELRYYQLGWLAAIKYFNINVHE